ncbi:hypothetical protein GCM10020221_34120 [Streptomyces thioluteus]|uniref:Uncharacterized protein n=1 Tax=Streptomyces thioluteus TaxID=66431 RepID=A0ABP6JM37_STRTU
MTPRRTTGVTVRPPASRPPWQLRLRRFGYVAPRAGGDVRERLVPPYPEPGTRLWTVLGVRPGPARLLARSLGWLGPLLVALVAGLTRFHNLRSPNAVIFDETYYAKDAWALWKYGYEAKWPDDINGRIIQGYDHVADAPTSSCTRRSASGSSASASSSSGSRRSAGASWSRCWARCRC